MAVLGLLLSTSCRPQPFRGPLRLLEQRTLSGSSAHAGSLTTGGETRPALLESARFRVSLPPRGLLTYGFGLSWSGDGEAPGWFQLRVRANGRTLDERHLNPRAARGWRDVSVPIAGLGAETELEFELRLTETDGRSIAAPAGLLLGVAEPTLHDLEAYGRAKGIVLVSIDTLRRDHVGNYGYPKPTTPHIDALARQGLSCDDTVSTSSWTLPAHLSMLTSVEPGAHGGTDLHHGFNHRVPALAELLHGAGFATQAVTSHLYVSSTYGVDAGFDRLDFHQDRKAKDVADRALDLLDRLGDKPFFIFLHFYDPHWHYDPPEQELRVFEPAAYKGSITGLWQDFKNRVPANTSPADMDHLLALYDGEIRYTDAHLGRVLAHLDELGLAKSTLVVVTSDHGEEFLDHGSWEHQKTLYEEVVRVPLLLRGPGIRTGRLAAQTSLLDVAPTILAWAGLAPAPTHRGSSVLSPRAAGEAYGETDHTVDASHKLFLRGGQGSWKLILSLDPGSDAVRKAEWYDLASDPRETKSAPPRDTLAASLIQRAVVRWREARGSSAGAPTVNISAEQKEELRAGGYLQ
jgi:arylsulfatase A-like enzyme